MVGHNINEYIYRKTEKVSLNYHHFLLPFSEEFPCYYNITAQKGSTSQPYIHTFATLSSEYTTAQSNQSSFIHKTSKDFQYEQGRHKSACTYVQADLSLSCSCIHTALFLTMMNRIIFYWPPDRVSYINPRLNVAIYHKIVKEIICYATNQFFIKTIPLNIYYSSAS